MPLKRENLTIDVNINPNDQPSATSTQIVEKPNMATRTPNVRQIASIGLLVNAGRQVGMTTLGNVGTITGNSQLQRRINRGLTVAGVGASFFVNPVVGAISLATTLGTDAFQTAIKIRNENNSAEYYRKVNGRRIDKGRIK